VVKQGTPKNVFFSPLKNESKKGVLELINEEYQTTVKKPLMVSKFYSEGDFFVNDVLPPFLH
jgi:hypothetical protein